MKKIILLLLTLIIAFALFGCNKHEQNEKDISKNSEVLLTEKQETESSINVSNENNYIETSTLVNQLTNDETESVPKEESTAVIGEATEENNKDMFFYVTFKDYNGDILKKEKVKKGEDATAPEIPKREGFIFIKWDTYYKEVKTDIVVTAIYEELTEPTLIVDTVEAADKDVVVKISVVNNPGLLALILKIDYDENVMTLKNVESGATMTDYTFTGPKNKKSGCNAAWNIIEVPEKVNDGEVAILQFEVNPDAEKGLSDVSVLCYDGAFNSNYESVKFNIINGSVNII